MLYPVRPQNTEPITRAFKAVEKGDNKKALEIIQGMGLKEPEAELQAIVDFVVFMKGSIQVMQSMPPESAELVCHAASHNDTISTVEKRNG
jgi:hypothetical protein